MTSGQKTRQPHNRVDGGDTIQIQLFMTRLCASGNAVRACGRLHRWHFNFEQFNDCHQARTLQWLTIIERIQSKWA
jgi:hypothetical protein